MNPKRMWANLAVSNLDRTTKFYTDLGFKSNGRNNDLTSFFFGDDKFVMHFFLKEVMEKNLDNKVQFPPNSTEVLYTLYADTREDVDKWAKEIEPAGGTLITQPAAFGEGYYGFIFADPDGHKFNVFNM